MNAKLIFQAAKAVAKAESLIPCFNRTETKSGEPLSDATISFNQSVSTTLTELKEIVEELLSQQQ